MFITGDGMKNKMLVLGLVGISFSIAINCAEASTQVPQVLMDENIHYYKMPMGHGLQIPMTDERYAQLKKAIENLETDTQK